jgi:hypothetical protein
MSDKFWAVFALSGLASIAILLVGLTGGLPIRRGPLSRLEHHTADVAPNTLVPRSEPSITTQTLPESLTTMFATSGGDQVL